MRMFIRSQPNPWRLREHACRGARIAIKVMRGCWRALGLGAGLLYASMAAAQTPPEDAAPPALAAPTQGDPLYVEGNLLFVLYHEAGHALISELQLPVLGREEDAVDQLATLLMLPEDSSDQEFEAMAIATIQRWFASASQTEAAGVAIPTWGEHGLDSQRAYQIACLLVASNPERFDALADSIRLPQERRTRCQGDLQRASASWAQVLAPHVLGEDEEAPGQVSSVVRSAPGFEAEEALVQRLNLLEDTAADLDATARFPAPIVIEARACGERNAFWNAQTRTITLCYEYVRSLSAR